jgi:hypothetical protein
MKQNYKMRVLWKELGLDKGLEDGRHDGIRRKRDWSGSFSHASTQQEGNYL